jgi:PAP2 superfamily
VSTVAPTASRRTPSLEVAREVAQVLAAFLLYNVGRMLATHDLSRANSNAHDVVDAERWLRLPAEASLQTWALGYDWPIELANRYYVSVHFPLTIAVLVWLFRYRRPTYHWAKRALLLATGVALVFHVLAPVTPPRLLSSLSMVDTGHAGGISIYQAPVLGSMSNEYAAMPSLHVGWALLVAIVLIAACRTRWRWLWLLHPVATVFVVVSTANHYWLDGVAGVVLVLGGLWLTRPRPERAQASASSAAETRRWASQISSGTRSNPLRWASRKPIS